MNGAFVLAIIATSAYFVTTAVDLYSLPKVPKPFSTKPVNKPSLAEEALFGHYDHVSEPQIANIGFTLVGLVVDPISTHSPRSIAMLRDAQGDTKAYHLGSLLPGGYEVSEIKPKAVFFQDSQGILYYLKLYTQEIKK